MNLNFFIYIIAILLVLIIAISITLLIKNRNKNKKSKSTFLENTNEEEENLPSYKKVKLPDRIAGIDSHSLFQAVNKVFESFIALEYSTKQVRDLDRVEWHSWQISMLISYLQRDLEFYIPAKKEIFHKSIWTEKKDEFLEDIDDIMVKYHDHVNTLRKKDDLCKDIIWTAREASILLFFIMFQKEFKEK